MPSRKPEKFVSNVETSGGPLEFILLPSLAHGNPAPERYGMVHDRFPVLRELGLCHVPRRDVFSRVLVNLRIQMHGPRRTYDLVPLVERVSTQLGRPLDGPDGHDRSSKTKGLLDRGVH